MSIWFYFFVLGLDLNNFSGCRRSTRHELGQKNTEESKLKNWCLTGLWNDLKWPQVTSDSFKGQIKWLKIRRDIILSDFPLWWKRYSTVFSVQQYSCCIKNMSYNRFLWLSVSLFYQVFKPYSSIIYSNELSGEKRS